MGSARRVPLPTSWLRLAVAVVMPGLLYAFGAIVFTGGAVGEALEGYAICAVIHGAFGLWCIRKAVAT